jgi:hypothetical protein
MRAMYRDERTALQEVVMPPLTVLSILAIFVILAFFVSRIEGLAFFAPKSTMRLKGAAQTFCLDQCQTDDGQCPLHVVPKDCPMWQFVNADLRTDLRIDPFRQLGGVES